MHARGPGASGFAAKSLNHYSDAGLPGPAACMESASYEKVVCMLRKRAVLPIVVLGLVALAVAPAKLSAVQDQEAGDQHAAATPPPAIALTFDDLPMTVVGNDHIAGPLRETQYINRHMLRVLKAHHATALGLVNEVKLNVEGERDARAQILEDWLAAGMLLGNHGYSHVEFSKTTLAGFEEEFVRGDTITAALLQQHHLAQRYFRPPYLDTGDTREKKTGFDSFLAAHGYRTAPFTIQNQDWMFNASYDEARRKHDIAALVRVRAAYLAHVRDEFDYAEELTRQTFGRPIAQVMFMHTDMLNADALDAVLTLMERRHYRFISLEEAMRDPAYRTPDNYVGSDGLSWLDRWQLALGRPIKPSEPQPPLWIQQDYKRITHGQ